MIISELEALLAKFRTEHGDIPVTISTTESEYEVDPAFTEVIDGTLVLETDLA